MKPMNILINDEDSNGYGFFCDTDDISPVQKYGKMMNGKMMNGKNINDNMNGDNNMNGDKYKVKEKWIRQPDIRSNHPVSFFISCVIDEPVKYTVVCIVSSMTALIIYTIMYFSDR